MRTYKGRIMSKQNHSCKTCFVFQFDFDKEKNTELLRYGRECQPEQIGIYNKDEVEQAIIATLGVNPIWKRHSFEIGRNEDYRVYVSDMIRTTIKDLVGKEQKIVELKKRFNLTASLIIVPYIVADSELPNQCLSLDDDVIAFLHKSGTSMDLDYYII